MEKAHFPHDPDGSGSLSALTPITVCQRKEYGHSWAYAPMVRWSMGVDHHLHLGGLSQWQYLLHAPSYCNFSIGLIPYNGTMKIKI